MDMQSTDPRIRCQIGDAIATNAMRIAQNRKFVTISMWEAIDHHFTRLG